MCKKNCSHSIEEQQHKSQLRANEIEKEEQKITEKLKINEGKFNTIMSKLVLAPNQSAHIIQQNEKE